MTGLDFLMALVAFVLVARLIAKLVTIALNMALDYFRRSHP